MDRRGAWTLGVGVLVAALMVLAASSGAVAIVRQAPEMPWEHAEFEFPAQRPGEPVDDSEPPPIDEEPPAGELPTVVSALVVALLAVSVVVGVVLTVRVVPGMWRERAWADWRRPPDDDDLDDADGSDSAAVAVAADADQQRQLLLQGDARNAIVACWLRLEAAVASAGVARRASDTSTELTERVLAGASVDPDAIWALATLYREARFSSHPMGEAERAAAVAALDAVHEGLRTPVPA